MSKPNSTAVSGLRGVRHNNLNGFDLDLPLHRLIVITGLSGSGKSWLAFDTLCAEGQRRAMGQARVGGATCDFVNARSNRPNPVACTRTVIATSAAAMRMESMVRSCRQHSDYGA
jgi:excinuclease UvrABC ATPase subunit